MGRLASCCFRSVVTSQKMLQLGFRQVRAVGTQGPQTLDSHRPGGSGRVEFPITLCGLCPGKHGEGTGSEDRSRSPSMRV